MRYFDADTRRPGLPPSVAALVSSIEPDATVVELVNLDPDAHTLIIQAGAFGEHTIRSVRHTLIRDQSWIGDLYDYGHRQPQEETSEEIDVDGPWLRVHLPRSTRSAPHPGTRAARPPRVLPLPLRRRVRREHGMTGSGGASILDCHVHFWDPERLTYAWLSDAPSLNHAFTAEDFAAHRPEPIEAIFVEVGRDEGQAMDEIEWVRGEAKRHPWDPRRRGARAARTPRRSRRPDRPVRRGSVHRRRAPQRPGRGGRIHRRRGFPRRRPAAWRRRPAIRRLRPATPDPRDNAAGRRAPAHHDRPRPPRQAEE